MHSQLHLTLAHESARSRTAPNRRRRVRARRSSRPRAAAALGLPTRAAPGTDAGLLGHS